MSFLKCREREKCHYGAIVKWTAVVKIRVVQRKPEYSRYNSFNSE
jgi:hypothetical protein